MKIAFIQAGGTIDKGYPSGDDHHGYGFEIGEPAFKRIISRVGVGFDLVFRDVVKKDSLDIDNDDRELILDACEHVDSDRIVVTHGTDTMIETAVYLNKIANKVIVLTGAMTPELFKDSDADFNIGFAAAAASTLNYGVYLAMSGQIFRPNEVTFDSELSQFVQKDA
ncbi:asparaginase [Candidatus Saccharibacteria bacterium]|nr:asparaginase [Candidatus Saccharibacteria bacterium]